MSTACPYCFRPRETDTRKHVGPRHCPRDAAQTPETPDFRNWCCILLGYDELAKRLEAYRSLAYAANGLRLEAGSGKPYSQLAHLLIAYDTARATVASLDRCTPATTEQKAAAGKGGA